MTTKALELPDFSLDPFTPSTPQHVLDEFVLSLRPFLTRVISVFNGKGGQGKTSLASHMAGLLAEGEAAKAAEGQDAGRVLLLEVDAQGNTLHDLGIKGHLDNDQGKSLAIALQFGDMPKIIRNVRSHLDVVPSGKHLEQIPFQMVTMQSKYGQAANLSLAVLLAKLSREYRWIIIDCPPVTKEPQLLALCAARWVLSPVSTGDISSIDGLGGVAYRFNETAHLNPDLELLGAVLFGFAHRYYTDRKTNEKRPVGLWVQARERIQSLLSEAGTDAPVFQAVIRDAETVAVNCRDRGQLSYEVGEAADGIKWWQKAKGETGTVLPTERAEEVGRDYEDLVVEVVERIHEVEMEEAAVA
ncbi:ParA family protein (plasmid) [Streptosporangium sp. CA-135522]|uniref:ParA family protein n=1 Tax=Streptosporangium sp. CA-135522 TaxID=3240072 RepID=UPI003D8BB917